MFGRMGWPWVDVDMYEHKYTRSYREVLARAHTWQSALKLGDVQSPELERLALSDLLDQFYQ